MAVPRGTSLGGVEDISRETRSKLERLAKMIKAESATQNLISASTVESFWDRHIRDSLQLVEFLGPEGPICDVGSGAGLPGLVLAVASGRPTTLIEPRRLRAEFLARAVRALGLPNVRVEASRAEKVQGCFDAITARAVARLDRLLAMTVHLSHAKTRFVFPKGRGAHSELELALRSWQCEVEEVASVTDSDARILILTNVRAKPSR